MIFCPECLLLGWRLKYKNNSFAKTWSYFTTEVEILIKMVPKMCRKIMEREREDDRRYFHEIERDFWEQEQQKKGNEDPGGKNKCSTTFGKGIPIIPGYKKHSLGESFW